jgi:ABC-type transport system involved in cytochrome bd biosynthesis fused ATPase/permease subunit
MMINKRLIGTVGDSKKYIAGNVISQWVSLVANICLMTDITYLLVSVFYGRVNNSELAACAVVALACVVVRFLCNIVSSRMSFLSSKTVKKTLRESIYKKLLSLGTSYREQVNTSEVVQVAVEGVDQLETYFGAYLPQFFYAMLAPLSLFVFLCFVNVPSAVVLLVCVPLIPVAIAAVQTWAKKLLSKYWGQYTALGDTFLENLQGLTTLKIYQADEYKNIQMNHEADEFRKITMKVLTMQLNSITIMDLIAYGGAALGVIMAVTQFKCGNVSLQGCLLIILLAADFFIPMRQLGSYFHIAMNGMAASDKIFRLLDLPEQSQDGKQEISNDYSIVCQNVSFSYGEDREVLHNVYMSFPMGSFTAIVGESGCGKSTIAAVLMGRNKDYTGSVTVGKTELKCAAEDSLMKNLTYISHQSYLFKGSVRDNLLMGKTDATDEELWSVLEKTRLADFMKSGDGLDTFIQEKGSNFSGGQCQRLALARALLHDSPVYIFDEATSNIDVESENDIMEQIHKLAETKTVILISHRLANVAEADHIYVMESGCVVEDGTHEELLSAAGVYEKLWTAQQELENYVDSGSADRKGLAADTGLSMTNGKEDALQ